MTWQGVSEAECYDNRSVIAQIVRIKDRLTAVEQNVDPTLREDLTAAIAELTALENTVGNVETQVETNTENIGDLQNDLGTFETATNAALALKADAADVDADLELKADKTQLTDGSVTQVGTATVGSNNASALGKAVYLLNGVPTAMSNTLLDTKHDATLDGMISPKHGWKALDNPSNVNVTGTGARWVMIAGWPYAAVAKLEAAAVMNANEGTACMLIEGLLSIQLCMMKWSGASNGSISFDMVKVRHNTSNSSFEIYARVQKPTTATLRRYTLSSFTSSTVTIKSVDNTVYEDVVQGDDHYPNVTNYLQYTWTDIGQTWTKLNEAA